MNAQISTKVAFFINKKAGAFKKRNIIHSINKHLRKDYTPLFIETYDIKEAESNIQQLLQEKIKLFVAVGGDGSINLLAKHLLNKEATLGIIPTGSGNGLARHLHIPLTIKAAMEVINRNSIISIDVGLIDNHPFFCAAGIGFDAHIIRYFHESKTRGLLTYGYLALREFFRFKTNKYTLEINEEKIEKHAFLITFANSGQYGNNAFIAPKANIQDEKIDVCILKPFPFYKIPNIAWRLFNRTIHHSNYWEGYQAEKVFIYLNTNTASIHFDGEPGTVNTRLEIKTLNKALKVLTNKNFT